MDTNRVNRILNATLNGAASGAAVYLAGRIGGYRFPRAAAALVGTAVGLGSYRALADVDFEAIEEAAMEAAEVDEPAEAAESDAEMEAEMEDATGVDVAVDVPGDEAHPRRRPPEVLSSAVEHAMGFRRGADEPSA